jgi:hypothetical protein
MAIFYTNDTFGATNIHLAKSRTRASSALFLNQWHHVTAVIYPTDYPDIYVNGQLDNDSYSGGDPTTELYRGSGNVMIGRQSIPAERYFNGIIDDVRVYNKALTQEEIQALGTGVSRANLNADDAVNFEDFAHFALEWLNGAN